MQQKTPSYDSCTPDEIRYSSITAMREYREMHSLVSMANLVGLWIWLYGTADVASLVGHHEHYSCRIGGIMEPSGSRVVA
jgi:hypothetical protein